MAIDTFVSLWLFLRNVKMIIQIFRIYILLFGFTVFVSGCSTNPPNAFARGGPAELLPKLTSVITGPVGVLLTNGSAFSSDFTIQFDDGSGQPSQVSGQLLMREGKIRLEAVFEKSMAAGDVGLIWNAASNQGCVFSEDLQGYAPIYGAIRFTNITTQLVTSPIDRMDGHPVEKANVSVLCSNGEKLGYQLVRAKDMGSLPIQINSLNSLQPFILTLSKVRLEPPGVGLFLPSDGFTKYASEAAMLNELGNRQLGGLREKPDQGVNINYKPAGASQY